MDRNFSSVVPRMTSMEHFDSTCWSLVDAAAKGGTVEREAFSEQYAPLIRRYLAARWRLPPGHDQVVEGSHEVVIQLLKPGGALANVVPGRAGGFRAYLYGVVRNVALMVERTARRHRDLRFESCLDPEQVEQSEATLSQAFDRAWVEMLAAQARRRMAEQTGPRHQAAYLCMEMRYGEGLPPREIALRSGRDVKEVYELLRTARLGYRRALLAVVAEHHPDCNEQELEAKCKELAQLL